MNFFRPNNFAEDTQSIMNESMVGGDIEQNGFVADLPSDFSGNNNSLSLGSHTFRSEDQNGDVFNTPFEPLSQRDEEVNPEDQNDQSSLLNKITSAFSGIGAVFSNGTKSLCCSSSCKKDEPVMYDIVNLPSGFDTFFDEKNDNSDKSYSSEYGAETMRSTMTTNTYTGVREMFQTPRFNDENSCLNPFAGCSLKMTRLIPQNENNSESDSSNFQKPAPITYKLHAIEVHQPISQYGSKDFNAISAATKALNGTLLQNGLEQFDHERTGLPAVTMAQIIQQHKAFLKHTELKQ